LRDFWSGRFRETLTNNSIRGVIMSSLILLALVTGMAIGVLVSFLWFDEGTKGITGLYTSKDGTQHTAKQSRGDHIV
jgi:hypothetical protein